MKKITVLTNSSVVSVEGDTALRSLKYKNNKTNEITEYRAEEGDSFGIFFLRDMSRKQNL